MVSIDDVCGVAVRRVDANELTDPGMRSLAALASHEGYEGCRLESCHSGANGAVEAVLVEVYVELGQAPTENDIREREAILVVAERERAMPSVYPVRSDFPQRLPHMNLNVRGKRRSLCLFDASPDDIAHLYNPAMLIERVRWWLEKSAFAELHGLDQPLDPALARSFYSLILPPGFDLVLGGTYFAFPKTNYDFSPLVLVDSTKNDDPAKLQFACNHLVTSPVAHGSMIDLPANVSELVEVYGEIGVDVTSSIKSIFDGDLNDQFLIERLKRKLLLVISSPLIGPNGLAAGVTTRAFISADVSLLDIGFAMGFVSEQDGRIGRMLAPLVDHDKLRIQQVLPLNVVDGFSRGLARQSSGLPEAVEKRLVVIGVGALGSTSVMNLARAGQSNWDLIDGDFVLPHNLVRHAAPGVSVGFSKADVLRQEINEIFGKDLARSHHSIIIGNGSDARVVEVIRNAERVLDFSASVPVARWLAFNDEIQAPISSYFVTPSGGALVALHEGSDRSGCGGIVEAAYYAAIFANPALHRHLEAGGQVQVGSCRNPSVTVPQSRFSVLAGLASSDVEGSNDIARPEIRIWTLSHDGSVAAVRHEVEPFSRKSIADWSVNVSPHVLSVIQRERGDGTEETGGILLGSFDLKNRAIYITGALTSPPDSVGGRTYYDRGNRGVRDSITQAEKVTMRHLTYVGEWHTHPKGFSSAPSQLDMELLKWIADLRALFLMPGIILILGDDGLRSLVYYGERVEGQLI
jgi:integrative and conjugative element protein (TIGR02256 family)